MKATYLLSLALSLPLVAETLPPTEDSYPVPENPAVSDQTPPVEHCGSIHDMIGRAGMAAVTVYDAQLDWSSGVYSGYSIMMMGGANFPNAKPGAKTPAERGDKVFYNDVVLTDPDAHGRGKPLYRATLPYAVGYAAIGSVAGKDLREPSPAAAKAMGDAKTPGYRYDSSLDTASHVVVAGGCNNEGHLAKVTQIVSRNGAMSFTELPELPTTVAYPAYACEGGLLYVIGGQEKADSVTALNRVFVLNLIEPEKGWKELAPLPEEGRMLATAGISPDGEHIYVTGGCSLHPDAAGKAERTYLKSTFRYNVKDNTWTRLTDAPETLVGAAVPMPCNGGGRQFFLVGGDPGNYYRASLAGQAPAEHPGQSKAIYAYDVSTNRWCKAGELPIGVATFPAVMWHWYSHWFTISGEIAPGVRTPLIIPITTDTVH